MENKLSLKSIIEELKENPVLIVFLVLALVSIILAILYLLVFPEFGNTDSTMVAAWFSFAGVVLFAAALFYQIKEFKLQREELIKSVEAQTNTSKALEEQKNIMLEQKQIALEQTTDAFLMNIVSMFIKYANTDKHTLMVTGFFESLKAALHDSNIWDDLLHNELSSKKFNDVSTNTLTNNVSNRELQYFVIFSRRTIGEIVKYQKVNGKQNYYLALLLNQLEFKTLGILVLAEYIRFGMYTTDSKKYFTDKGAINHMLQCLDNDDTFTIEKLSKQVFDDLNSSEAEPKV